ncbi:MAM domain-containing glycosylphosphatidylinositol anchor protein 2-like [Argopecten irradians]|uniref:MAM domain-containing glycosylphosphatidylinositol anchor protein 2-like n=1 Tax=Argopecten irradians TaxID=31199 RepID=UPI00371D06C5
MFFEVGKVVSLSCNTGYRILTGPPECLGTGSWTDSACGGGNYYYFEASSPRQQGDTARLETTFSVPIGVQICVSLWYHMYGRSMGSLRISTKDSAGTQTNSQVIASGDQGQQWHQSSKTFPAQNNTVWIVIEGIRGSATKSDICIDDIEIYAC